MRKKLLAVIFSALMIFSGYAAAEPPDGDPTCGAGQREDDECPGDNGGAGCKGLNQAKEHAGETPGYDLATDILTEGEEGDCEDSN